MAYTLFYSGGNFVVNNGTLNAVNTSLSLPGRNFSGYGPHVDQDLLSVLENFASSDTGPAQAIPGQLWFAIANPDAGGDANVMKYNTANVSSNVLANANWETLATSNATANVKFGRVTTGNIYSPNVAGNIVWNSGNSTWVVSGNMNGNFTGNFNGNVTGNISGNITGNFAVPGSNTQLLYNNNNQIAAATNLTYNGVTLGMVGIVTATGNITGGNLLTGGTVSASGAVTAVGNVTGGNISTVGAISASSVTASGNISGGNLTTGGSVSATNMSATNASLGTVTTTNLSTGSPGTGGTITGNWNLGGGSRMTATYADLAERHHADDAYTIGTVMTVGGANEVTKVNYGDRVLGVVSNNYAYLMNSESGTDETHPAIAYVGRVPVRIIGAISKHETIVGTVNGCARSTKSKTADGFGWALETNMDEGEKLVLCIIK